MSKDITDALDAYLIGKVKVGEWQNDFLTSWILPLVKLDAKIIEEFMLNQIKSHPNINQDKLQSNLSPEALRRLRGE